MAESEVGTAVLRLRVETASALQALEAFRNAALAAFSGLNTGNPFDGFGRGAAAAGRRVGRRLRKGVEEELKQLKFESVKEALNFNPANTIAGLRTYSKALRDLAEVSDLASGDTQDLFDRISAVDNALKRASSSSAQLAAEQRKLNADLAETVRLREQEAQALLEVELQRGRAIGALKSSPISGRQADGSIIPGSPSDPRNPAPLLKQLRQATTEAGSFDISSLRRVSDAAVEAGMGLQDFTKAIINGQLALPKTTANLNEITRSFQSLAASTKSGTAEFNNFTQAAAKSEQKALLAQLDELKALREVFEFGRAPNSKGGLSKDSFRGTEELLAFAKQVERTPAAIQVYITALEQAQAVTKLSDANFAKLTAEIDRQRAAFDAATRSAEAFSRIQRLSAEERKRVADAFTSASRAQAPRALPSSDALAARIAADGGTQPQRLQPGQLNQTREQQLTALRRQAEEARKLAVAERQSKDEQVQLNVALEAGLQVLRTTLGVIDEQVQGYRFQNEVLDEQLSKQRQLQQIEAQRSEEARKRLAAEAKDRAAREQGRGREIGRLNAVPIDGRLPGGGFAPGSPGARAALRRRLTEAGSNALIGGAFPALFGQGLGASVGGALGGGAGGLVGGQFGFGLSLVGTALGAQFDEATRKLQTLGSALSDPVGQLSALSEAGLISSKGLEKQVQALIDTGREAEAAALIQKDLANTYGDLQNAKDLAAASDELNRSWARLQVSIASLVGSPIVDLLADTTSALQKFATAVQGLRNVIPEPVRKQVSSFGTDFALGALLPGVKSVRDIAKFLPGFGGGSGGGSKQQQTEITANERVTELRQLRLRLISAEAQGQQELTLQLERQRTELEKQAALENSRARNESPLKQQEIAAKFNEQLLRIDERRLALERERTSEVRRRVDIERAAANELGQIRDQFAAASRQAANENAAAREELAIQQRRAGGLGSSGASALASVNSIEAAKREVELAQVRQTAAQNAAIRAEREALILRERIDTLRKEGASQSELNTAEQAALAARNAAEQARNEYELGGKALEAAGVAVKTSAFQAKADLNDLLEGIQDIIRSLSRGIEDSVGSLRKLQNTGGEGLNRFLSAQQVADRQAAVGRQLAPEAQRLAERLGVQFSVSGTREQINAQLIDFIEAARNELRITEDIGQAQRELAKATNDLTTINDALKTVTGELATLTGQLAENTAALASKDWNIYVNASASGDLPRGVEVYQQ